MSSLDLGGQPSSMVYWQSRSRINPVNRREERLGFFQAVHCSKSISVEKSSSALPKTPTIEKLKLSAQTADDKMSPPPDCSRATKDGMARAISAINTADFFPAILNYMRSIVPFSGVFITHLHRNRAPGHVYDNVRAERHRIVVDQYLDNAYLLDPVYDAFLSGRTNCAMRLRDIAPDQFMRSMRAAVQKSATVAAE